MSLANVFEINQKKYIKSVVTLYIISTGVNFQVTTTSTKLLQTMQFISLEVTTTHVLK